jgi:hypothetical protein
VNGSAGEPEDKTPIEQAVEHAFDLFVYAPIGLLFEGTSLLPELIAKGKSQVAVARMMGKFAVDKAGQSATSVTAKLQDQTAGVIDFIGESITPLPAEPAKPASAPAAKSVRATAAKTAAKAASGVAQAINAASLAIPDYDGLSASQVVNRLAGLSPVELKNVQLYEAAHRGRKTILSKVAQLQGN